MIEFYEVISIGFIYGSITFLGVGIIAFGLRLAFKMLKKAN